MKKRFIAIPAIAALTLIAAPVCAKIETTENVLTGSSKHILAIDSSTTVANSIGAQKHATIIIRCEGSSMDAYVYTPTYNGLFYRTRPRVSNRWDDGKITEGAWDASKGGNAMFHGNPKRFLGELIAAKKFVFGWQPYSRQSVAARWDLAGHKADLKEMQKICS